MVTEAILSSVATFLTGFVAPIARQWIDSRIEIDRMRAETQTTIAEKKHLEKIQSINRDIVREKMAGEQKIYSYLQDEQRYSKYSKYMPVGVRYMMGVVDFMRGAARPLITGFQVWTQFALLQAIGGLTIIQTLPIDDRVKIVNDLIEANLILTFMAVGWWFGHKVSGLTSR